MKVILHAKGTNPLGLAVARSLGKKNIDFAVITENNPSITASSKYCHERIISDSDFLGYAGLSELDIVFPVMNDDVILGLAKNASKLRCTLGFSDYTVLEKVIHKNQMVRHAIEQGISCPETIFINQKTDFENLKIPANFPVVLKPDLGYGGRGISIVRDTPAFHAAGKNQLMNRGSFIIQEKISYDYKCTVGVLCNRESELKRICILKEVRNHPVGTGPACCVESIYRQDIVDICKKLMKSLNFYGIADIDFLIDRDGKPWFMEINPRFWGSCQGAIAAGVDFPFLLYKMITEGDLDTSLNYRTGIRCRYVIFDDLMHLATIISGRYPRGFKMRTVMNFLDFYGDDGYYVFSWDDIKPFFILISIKLSQYLSRRPIT
jgi:predicted ATP-grasp superfamily ATP-dependent carboligase